MIISNIRGNGVSCSNKIRVSRNNKIKKKRKLGKKEKRKQRTKKERETTGAGFEPTLAPLKMESLTIRRTRKQT